MRLLNWRSSVVCFLILVIGLAACKKDARTRWNTDMLVPIATTSLSLTNIVKDSSLKVNADSSLTIAYQSSLYKFNLASQIVKFPDTSIGQKFTLDSLTLGNPSFYFGTSLGDLAHNMSLSGNALGDLLIANNGNQMVIPALSGFSPGSFYFSAAQFFDSAVLISGTLQIWAVNNLPVPINGGNCVLSDSAEPSRIFATVPLPSINAHDSAYFEIPVGGTRITSEMAFTVSNMSTPGSNGQAVLIDTSNDIRLHIFATNFHVSEAWAKFPAQNVVNLTEDVTVPINDRKFTYIDARSGKLHIFINNSVPQPLYLQYTLVGAYNNRGQPLIEYTTVPPYANGIIGHIDTVLDITGYSINLTGKNGAGFNTYTQRIEARIDSTGERQHITLADSLNIRYELENIAPNYIKGYAGRDTSRANDSAAFSFLNIFKSGSIDLERVNMTFSVLNGIGVDGQVKINSLTAISPNNGTRTLSGSILGQPLNIKRASDFPLTPSLNNFAINNSNSNIKDLLGILPNKLLYDVEVKTNLNGNTQQYRDFAYLSSNLDINLNAEIPLSFIANHLVLKDTIGFDLANTNTNVNGINDGIINVIVQNKYPIEANMSMIIYNDNWSPVDTLLLNTDIMAADLNNNCRAEQPKRTKVQVYVDPQRMDKIKTGKHAVVIADFSTASNNANCNGQHLKIYSDYIISLTLTAKFNYKVSVGL